MQTGPSPGNAESTLKIQLKLNPLTVSRTVVRNLAVIELIRCSPEPADMQSAIAPATAVVYDVAMQSIRPNHPTFCMFVVTGRRGHTMMVWRILGSILVIFAALGASASAEHSPHFDVECPTGTAQIVLDPGHGGPDPGAVNEQFGLYERDVVLEIAMRAAEVLRKQGYTVALTRSDNDTELGNSERGEIANACQALVLVEIHLNGSTDPDVNYSQAFWGEKEKDLALSLTMNQALTSLGLPLANVDRFDNGGLLRAKMPSVLVESAFLTNRDEAKKLANGKGARQEEMAQAIANGIAIWMELQD